MNTIGSILEALKSVWKYFYSSYMITFHPLASFENLKSKNERYLSVWSFLTITVVLTILMPILITFNNLYFFAGGMTWELFVNFVKNINIMDHVEKIKLEFFIFVIGTILSIFAWAILGFKKSFKYITSCYIYNTCIAILLIQLFISTHQLIDYQVDFRFIAAPDKLILFLLCSAVLALYLVILPYAALLYYSNNQKIACRVNILPAMTIVATFLYLLIPSGHEDYKVKNIKTEGFIKTKYGEIPLDIFFYENTTSIPEDYQIVFDIHSEIITNNSKIGVKLIGYSSKQIKKTELIKKQIKSVNEYLKSFGVFDSQISEESILLKPTKLRRNTRHNNPISNAVKIKYCTFDKKTKIIDVVDKYFDNLPPC